MKGARTGRTESARQYYIECRPGKKSAERIRHIDSVQQKFGRLQIRSRCVGIRSAAGTVRRACTRLALRRLIGEAESGNADAAAADLNFGIRVRSQRSSQIFISQECNGGICACGNSIRKRVRLGGCGKSDDGVLPRRPGRNRNIHRDEKKESEIEDIQEYCQQKRQNDRGFDQRLAGIELQEKGF